MMTMRNAIIYVRVSTEEQSEKGYSLAHQEERLRNYFKQHNITVVGFYKEDHSAKTFERPAFNELLSYLKKNKKAVDLLLFLKWDRFSRNAGDAYGMINTLHKLGVEPQAMEQPLDLSVPENKIMLAFYLAAPEVENDRRSLNVIAGMRRAMKDGRYCTTAPKGYKNARNDTNRPIIVPGNDAHLVRWLFEEVASGINNVKDLWRVAVKKGLKVGRSNIFYLLRNPVYMGKLYVPAYKDEEAIMVKGIHEPLISEGLFYEAQDVLDGKKRKQASVQTGKAELPLRGFLICRKCGNRLTGSASTGRNGKYFYYHCTSKCGERYKAEEANDHFFSELQKFSTYEEEISLFEGIAADYYKKAGKHRSISLKEIDEAIEKNQARITNALRKMSDDEITSLDYREIKNLYEPEIEKLTKKKYDLSKVDDNLMAYISTATKVLRDLPNYYENATLSTRQKLIGSMYPEKLVYENKSYRTTRINEAARVICNPDGLLEGLKKGQASEIGSLSEQVTRIGFEPMTPSLEGWCSIQLSYRAGTAQ